ncbi:MAG: hypothetical protein M0P69_13010 [Bacteroidales bacterium]|nr:hypothetical protein [Bacteroidales bacterium]
MKRTFAIIAALAAVLVAPVIIHAAGTATETKTAATGVYSVDTIYSLNIAWTAGDDSTYSLATTSTIRGQILSAVTIPDTSDTGDRMLDNYDITITGPDGDDLFGGTLANRDSVSTERALPKIGSDLNANLFINGPVTVTIDSLGLAGARGTIKLYYRAR